MRSLGTLIFVGLGLTSALGISFRKQLDGQSPIRLAIHHADPWMVKAMLEGKSTDQPELSTIWQITGGGNLQSGGQAGAGSPFLRDGYLVVNPTDNSLWWYPNKK